MKKTIISNFYNEEFLLPFWLKHHKKYFDHGILIDYDSTDSSREIIKEITPTWDIVKSRNQWFDAFPIDEEIVDYEKSVDGWKITLNTTEFVFVADFNNFVDNLPEEVNGVFLDVATMVDPPEFENKPLHPDVPLVLQRWYGSIGQRNPRGSERLLFKKPHGEYLGAGRHTSTMEGTIRPKGVYHLWFGFSPWCEAFKKRKLSFKEKIVRPDGHVAVHSGGDHLMSEEQLLNKLNERRGSHCRNLCENPQYYAVYSAIKKEYGFEDIK